MAQPSAQTVVTILNERGLHARAAAKFVKLAGSFDAAL
ncbi:MAG: HPr family phosphocarrier protein, partial [Proteobacteria bacterium]|nr:HPr family phosphocarrier protein [Pseudomonadota bacterium]